MRRVQDNNRSAILLSMDTSQQQPPQLAPGYPVNLDVQYPEHPSRLWALGTLFFLIPKMVVLIPHLIILYVLGFVAMVVAIIGQLAVLFIGRYPRGLFDFVVGFSRWQMRVNGFLMGLTDTYPPFRFK